jgi:hypothetical protein
VPAERKAQEQTQSTVFDLIEDRKKQGWVFVFIGANRDVYATGRAMSVSVGNSMSFDASHQGTKRRFTSLSESTAKYRTSTPEQRISRSDRFLSTDDPSDE